MDGLPKAPRADVSGKQVCQSQDLWFKIGWDFIVSTMIPKCEECIVSFNLGSVCSLYF